MFQLIKKVWSSLRGDNERVLIIDKEESISIVNKENPKNPFTNRTLIFPKGKSRATVDES